MKKTAFFLLFIPFIILSSCSAPYDYGGFIAALHGDPDCSGYSYTNGAAVYEIRQRKDDVRVDFKSYVQPDSDLSASRTDGKTVYSDGKSCFADEKNEYNLPVTADRAVVDWLYDELKTYGAFTLTASEDEKYDVLTANKTERISKDEIDVACDKYEIFLPYKDGKNYVMTFYDFEDGADVFMGSVPQGISAADGWLVDTEKGLLYNNGTNESYSVVVTLLDSYKPTGEFEEQTKTAYVYIDKSSHKVSVIKIICGDTTDEYTVLYPDKITPLDTEGQAEMTDKEKEHAATMIALMISSL